MYSSVLNQAIHIAHYLLSFMTLCIVIPKFILPFQHKPGLDNFFGNYMMIVLCYIICGYLLVMIKLYEFISIVMFMIAAKVIILYKQGSLREERDQLFAKANHWAYDFADGRLSLNTVAKNAMKKGRNSILSTMFKMVRIDRLLLIVILACSLYIRIDNAFIHAAPSMSDSSVVLAWMKYIENRILFHDGIYPQGFHIYLAMLHKFSSINQLYIVNYTGPVNGLLTALGIYFMASRFAGSSFPGLVAAMLYGLLGNYLLSGWARQAATNSQEFGYLFIMPTFYFCYKYLSEKGKSNFAAAFCGLCVIGLVHTVAFAFVGIGIMIMVFVFLITDPKNNRASLLKVCIMGAASVIVAVLPLGFGMLMRIQFNQSSADYLVSKLDGDYFPPIRTVDYIAFAALAIIAIYILLNIKKFRQYAGYLFLFLYGAVSYLIIYFGPSVTKSTVIANRFSDMWNLFVPVIIGVGAYILLLIVRQKTVRTYLQYGLAGIGLAVCLFYFKPQPIIPYKVQTDAMVEQHLKISNEFRPTEWTLVSDIVGGYALTYGYGYHMQAKDFMEAYSPTASAICALGSDVKLPNVFIYYEKTVYVDQNDTISGATKTAYEERLKENSSLGDWITKYKETHDNLTIYYEDNDLVIYYIKQGDTNDIFKSQ